MIATEVKTVVLKCDCHGTQNMAYVTEGVLRINLRSNGRHHTLRVPLNELLRDGLLPGLDTIWRRLGKDMGYDIAEKQHSEFVAALDRALKRGLDSVKK